MYALDEDLKERLKMESRLRRGNARGSWGLPQARTHGTDPFVSLLDLEEKAICGRIVHFLHGLRFAINLLSAMPPTASNDSIPQPTAEALTSMDCTSVTYCGEGGA